MEKIKIKHKNFIEQYEKNIKSCRDEYYKNIIKNSNKNNLNFNPSFIFFLIPLFIAIIIILKENFSILGYIIAFTSLIIINILIKLLAVFLKFENKNKYLEEIRKQGCFSIDSYEKKLKIYITGPGGYYEQLLNAYKQEYNITDKTQKIYGINGEEYYIWANQQQDKINLLNCKCKNKPEIKSYKIMNIRYYRVDQIKHMIVLKTNTENIYLTLSSIEVLNELLKQKKFENITSFTPEDHINDFEIFMHNYKKEIDSESISKWQAFSETISKLITIIIIIAALVGISTLIDKYASIIKLCTLVCFFISNIYIRNIISLKRKPLKTDEEYISYINSSQECIDMFEELKYALNISDSYDRVYTKEGACYLTWVANGYFHVFLNVIYFNVVYMAINTSDVIYYRITNKDCTIKLKDKELIFQKDAGKTFSKILPNKDYDWLKGYQNAK